jgi:uncharacterized glyoxalase superfamily protein PhnB
MPRFEALGIVVSDLARSVAFYRELGLDLPDGDGHIETTVEGGLRFMLDSEDVVRSFDESWEPPDKGHRIAIAFRCDTPQEVDALYEKLLGMGGSEHKTPFDAFWGHRYAQVEDPDGNVVDLFAELER